MAATATKATIIRYSTMPCPRCRLVNCLIGISQKSVHSLPAVRGPYYSEKPSGTALSRQPLYASSPQDLVIRVSIRSLSTFPLLLLVCCFFVRRERQGAPGLTVIKKPA